MPFPDSESPEEEDTALERDAVGENGKEKSSEREGLADGGGICEKVEGSSNLIDGRLSGDVEAKNTRNDNAAGSHVPEMDEYGERISSEESDEIVIKGIKDSKEMLNNIRAREGWKDMDEKAEVKETCDMDMRSNDQEKGKVGDDDQDWDNSEEKCPKKELEEDGREEDASVRDILDKYLPLLERGGAGVDQREGKFGGGQEVENNRNHNKGELEDGDQSTEMVVNRVEQVDEEDLSEKIEDGSAEMVVGIEDIRKEEAVDEDPEIMADRENIFEEKMVDQRMLLVNDKEDIGEEKSFDKSLCEGGVRMSNAGRDDDPGGILTNLVFGNFDSKGRYLSFPKGTIQKLRRGISASLRQCCLNRYIYVQKIPDQV